MEKHNGNREVKGEYAPPTDGPELADRLASKIISRANETALEDIAKIRSRMANTIRRARYRAIRVGHRFAMRIANRDIILDHTRLSHNFHKLSIKLRADCVELALAIAQEVIADELVTNPLSVRKRVSRAVKFMLNSPRYKAVLNPEDLGRAENNDPKTPCATDPEISRGHARIETSNGVTVLDPLAHLGRIAEELKNNLAFMEE